MIMSFIVILINIKKKIYFYFEGKVKKINKDKNNPFL